ncbi:hypothetical protein C6A45_07430 [Enterobacter hormaechei]|nr:hypothetical protein AM451_16825 [Enterobacter cloacae complex sp.]AWV77644.1 hypothetical protein DN066_20485 [Enterobacter hormaechei subsp. xiangfangensis]RAY44115.1 hypothetical protein DP193_15815 [Enterobacter hormaechei subsp. oharae]RCA16255.1 hypothetical protein C6A45_07430 [Enterobacter hormaechei]RAY58856.1 hypothetical protein DP200_15680 [Enterobacter hormaechei subsp. oharae]
MTRDETVAIQYHSALSIPGPIFRRPSFLTGSNYCLQLKIRAEQLCLLHLVNAGSAIQKANLD